MTDRTWVNCSVMADGNSSGIFPQGSLQEAVNEKQSPNLYSIVVSLSLSLPSMSLSHPSALRSYVYPHAQSRIPRLCNFLSVSERRDGASRQIASPFHSLAMTVSRGDNAADWWVCFRSLPSPSLSRLRFLRIVCPWCRFYILLASVRRFPLSTNAFVDFVGFITRARSFSAEFPARFLISVWTDRRVSASSMIFRT